MKPAAKVGLQVGRDRSGNEVLGDVLLQVPYDAIFIEQLKTGLPSSSRWHDGSYWHIVLRDWPKAEKLVVKRFALEYTKNAAVIKPTRPGRQVIGGEEFGTLKAVVERAQSILHSAPIGTVINGNNERFLRGLLNRHPSAKRKIGCGVRTFRVITPLPHHTRTFAVERYDGSREIFGYRICVSGGKGGREVEVRKAFRGEVRDQIQRFRTNRLRGKRGIICPVTNHWVSRREIQVDHVVPNTFASLLEEFLTSSRLTLRDVKLDYIRNEKDVSVKLADRGLASRWQVYHRAHAVLRLLSKEANAAV